jgi:hypothetical protein
VVPYVLVEDGGSRMSAVQGVLVAPGTSITAFKSKVIQAEKIVAPSHCIFVYSLETWEAQNRQSSNAAVLPSALDPMECVPEGLSSNDRYLVVDVRAGRCK